MCVTGLGSGIAKANGSAGSPAQEGIALGPTATIDRPTQTGRRRDESGGT
jgi:hypothetical protein